MTKRELKAKIERLERDIARTDAERDYWCKLAQQRQAHIDRAPIMEYRMVQRRLS